MFNIEIITADKKMNISAPEGRILADVLRENEVYVSHPCGGAGKCGKCLVKVNGKDELSCKYEIKSDISVLVPQNNNVYSYDDTASFSEPSGKMFIAVDIGTTTVAFALCNEVDGSTVRTFTCENPQREYGSDVISRIAYCSEKGTFALNKAIIGCINNAVDFITKDEKIENITNIYVSGNTVMLHLLFNVDCSSMGVSPYTPAFLEEKRAGASALGLNGKYNIISLPCISSFVGGDITAGLCYCGMPKNKKYNMLLDLGTNAEIVLYSEDKILCTSAAAGPCFEGANIECGMSAGAGAVCSYYIDGSFDVLCEDENKSFAILKNGEPVGICASGLVDLISVLRSKGIIDRTGEMPCRRFEISESVYLSQGDIREFQNGKSAVYSAIEILIEKAGLSFDDIENFCVAGGFSAGLNGENAASVGLFPRELVPKFRAVNNSSLKGTIKYAVNKEKTEFSIADAEYIDLSLDGKFPELFIKNMYL